MSENREDLEKRLEALAGECELMEGQGLTFMPGVMGRRLRALLAEAREGGKPLPDGYLEAVSAPVWPPASAGTSRHHSGIGRLVYASDTDDIGQCWCDDCREWIPADKWNQPCLSKRERRKKNRRVSAGTEGQELRDAAIIVGDRLASMLSDDCGCEGEGHVCGLPESRRELDMLRKALASRPVVRSFGATGES